MDDYDSVFTAVWVRYPGAMLDRELKTLHEHLNKIIQLHEEHTAPPENGKAGRKAIIANRATWHFSIEGALATEEHFASSRRLSPRPKQASAGCQI